VVTARYLHLSRTHQIYKNHVAYYTDALTLKNEVVDNLDSRTMQMILTSGQTGIQSREI